MFYRRASGIVTPSARWVSRASVVLLLLGLAVGFPEATASHHALHASDCRAVYRVKEGDTLIAIAQRFRSTASRVADASGIEDPDLIAAGQVVCVPRRASTATPSAAGAGTFCRHQAVVRAGDTLDAIARRFDVSVAEISAANDIADPNLILQYERLCIPGRSTRPTPFPTSASGFPCRYDHLARRGDTLEGIARRYDSTVAGIVKTNPEHLRELRENIVMAGVQLCIP